MNLLGLKVESLGNQLYVSSPLGIMVRVDQICLDCELEISDILLRVDLQVMDISYFDVILSMDWLTVHRVVIDYDRRRITTYTQDGIRVTFQEDKRDALPQTVHDSRWQEQLMGWLASLTWRIRGDRIWVYLGWFVSMRMSFWMNYLDYLYTRI